MTNNIHPVWLSLTTIPERMKKTCEIVKKLLETDTTFDKIVLNIPHRYKRFKNTPDCRDLETIRDSRFILNRTPDYGPLTKLLPTLDIIPPESILIICDDSEYRKGVFELAARSQENNRSKSFTYWKYDYKGIDIPQGVDIITFWTPNLDSFRSYASNAIRNDYCFYVDDMVIGNYLKSRGIVVEQLVRHWKWPWIPDDNEESLFSNKGKYNRDTSNKMCWDYLNR